LRETPEGVALVDRLEGYFVAVRSFIASGLAAEMFATRGLVTHWAFPYVKLYANGAWETGEDTLTQPVILSVCALPGDAVAQLEEDLHDALGALQPWAYLPDEV
jgi:hypothetical protein